VPNHSSDEHEWFVKSVQRIDPYTDYYVWNDGKVDENGTRTPPNNWVNKIVAARLLARPVLIFAYAFAAEPFRRQRLGMERSEAAILFAYVHGETTGIELRLRGFERGNESRNGPVIGVDTRLITMTYGLGRAEILVGLGRRRIPYRRAAVHRGE